MISFNNTKNTENKIQINWTASNFCASKNTINRIKRKPQNGRKTVVNHLPDKGLITTIYQELLQLKEI